MRSRRARRRAVAVGALVAGGVTALAGCGEGRAGTPGGGLDVSGKAAIAAAAAGPRTDFDGAQAMRYVREQLAFGPRVPGTPGHRAAAAWIAARARAAADTVLEQRWTHVTTDGARLPLVNVLARFRPELRDRVLYVAHWDSRPVAEHAARPEDRRRPIPGANDGASGVAVLLALADALKRWPPVVGVDLLFVDGEDYGDFGTGDPATMRDVLIGSRAFARALQGGGPTPPVPHAGYAPTLGVVWDMVGDTALTFFVERISLERARPQVQAVWTTAERLGYGGVFRRAAPMRVVDDHVPLLDAGLPVVDVIDAHFPAHHSLQDDLGAVHPRSLQIVGDVATALVRSRGPGRGGGGGGRVPWVAGADAGADARAGER